MANRSYLYSLSNRPTHFTDRPETISGLSEWPYAVPFMYRLLMSGDPQLCASLISDGLEDEEPDQRTRLPAISSTFEPGLARVKRFAEIVRTALATPAAAPAAAPATPAPATPEPASLLGKLKRLFSSDDAAPAGAAKPAARGRGPTSVTRLLEALDETLVFLEAHRNEYLLLETIELELMMESEEAALKANAEKEIARCRQAGAALDALPADPAEAGRQLLAATAERGEPPLDAFHGLRLDDGFDGSRTGNTDYVLGLAWSDVLYFALHNREEFETRQAQPDED